MVRRINHQSSAFTIGKAIWANGGAIMLIAPDDDKPLVKSKASPQDIDQVRVDRLALLRHATFNHHTTPGVNTGGVAD